MVAILHLSTDDLIGHCVMSCLRAHERLWTCANRWTSRSLWHTTMPVHPPDRDCFNIQLILVEANKCCRSGIVVTTTSSSTAALPYNQGKSITIKLLHTSRYTYNYHQLLYAMAFSLCIVAPIYRRCLWLGWRLWQAIALNNIVANNKLSMVVHRSNMRNPTSLRKQVAGRIR